MYQFLPDRCFRCQENKNLKHTVEKINVEMKYRGITFYR